MKQTDLEKKIEDILNKNQQCDCPCSGAYCNNFVHPHKKGCINENDYIKQIMDAISQDRQSLIEEIRQVKSSKTTCPENPTQRQLIHHKKASSWNAALDCAIAIIEGKK